MSSATTAVFPRPAGQSADRVARRWVPDRSWWLSVCAAAMAIVVFAFARNTLIDDAYTFLAYARNLAFHWHWGLIPNATTNTATSVLNVWLLALFSAITRKPVLALGIVYVLSTLALEYGLRRVARAIGLPTWLGLLATAIVVFDPLLMSSVGMEVALAGGLIALLMAAAVAGRPVWFGILAGLLVLTRPDLVIVVLVVFVFVRSGWRRWWWSPIAALVVTVPWYVWSWFKLGSAVPVSLFIKKDQLAWPALGTSYSFGSGPLLYLHFFPMATVLSFLPAILGLLAAIVWLVLRIFHPTDRVRQLDRLAPLALAGVLHYLAYSLLGVPPYHWYYGPSVICLSVFLAAAVVVLARREGRSAVSVRPRSAPLALTLLLVVAFIGHYGLHGLPPSFAPIETNLGSAKEYQQLGSQLDALIDGRSVKSSGEIGTEAYFCDCTVIDLFSDPAADAALIPPVLARSGPLTRALLKLNFRHTDYSQQPVVPQQDLEYVSSVPPGAIAVWPVSSPWAQNVQHYVVLMPPKTSG